MTSIARAILVLTVLSSPAAMAQASAAGAGGAGGKAPAAPVSQARPAVPAQPPAAAPAAAAAAAPAPATTGGPRPAVAPAPAAAAAPVKLTPNLGASKEEGPPRPTGSVVPAGAGLSPSLPQIGSASNVSARQMEELASSTSHTTDEWKFQVHGYLRAPLRFSWGPPTPAVQPSIYDPATNPGPKGSFRAPYAPGEAPPPGTELHGTPRVPGYSYTTWAFTNTIGGPWTQLDFSYGNSRVMGTVIVDSYNQTDGSYRNLQAQQGIDQVFLTMNFPEAFGDRGGLVWNIGSFQNRYGVAGKYDAGMYETYLFGRTHIAGSTWTGNFSNVDAAGDWSLIAEAGFGSKLDVVPFLNNQNYQVFQNVPIGANNGSPYLSDRSPDYLPWAGPVPQGSTYLHHEHLVAKYRSLLTFGLHYLFTWTPDDNWSPINSRQISVSTQQVQAAVPRARGPIQGSMEIWGGEVKLSGGPLGYGYLGYAHIDARNINALAESLEIGHSYGGPGFKQNYFGESFNAHTGVYDGPQNETGIVQNISAQYSFSFAEYARAPEEFWGDGSDLVLTAFGFLSIVDSKPPAIALTGDPAAGVAGDPARAKTWDMSTKKLKFGFDAFYNPLSWVGVGARFDVVQPDLDAAYSRTPAVAGNPNVPLGNPGGSDLNFELLTGRVVFRTEFLTHETITLAYSHYFLGRAAYPNFPYAWVAKADADALSLAATLWW